MKKRLLSIIILVSFMFSAAVMNVSAETVKPSHLLILGDSISTGYGLPGDKATSKSFGNLLAKSFGLTNQSYTNLAVNGATSQDLLSVVSANTKSVASADTIMISIGGNDFLGVIFSNIKAALGLPVGATISQLELAFLSNSNAASLIAIQLQKAEVQAQFAAAQTNFIKNTSEIITAIKAANPTAKLYIQTIYNPFDGVPYLANYVSSIDPVALSLNTAIEKGAAAGNYSVIDTYSAFKGKALTMTNISSFDIHPNEAGHNAIFNMAYTAITGVKYTAPKPPVTKPTAPAPAKPSTSAAAKPVSTDKVINPATGSNTEIPIAVTAVAVTFSCVGIAAFRKKSY